MARRAIRQVRQTQIPQVKNPRSQFNRSYAHRTTFDAGLLIPVHWCYILPGDTVNMDGRGFVRLATPYKPIMDGLYLDTHWWFVPLRLIWTNFVKMMGEQANPGDSISYTVPQSVITGTTFTVGTVQDYMGIPIRSAVYGSLTFSSLPFRAYDAVYTNWYRDQNLQNSIVVPLGDGPDAGYQTNKAPYKRGKRHDYFTSCLVAPQKGAAVSLPLGSQAPLRGLGTVDGTFGGVGGVTRETGGGTPTYAFYKDVTGAGNVRMRGTAAASGFPDVYADLSAATAATINQLRQAFQVQRLLERDARGGTRYIEQVYSQFGVVSPDARLQRPEYLGGGTAVINVSPIAQTAPQQAAGVTTPQGNLAAMGTGAWSGHGFVKSFTEHGILLGIISVRADLTYQQGLHREWSYLTRYDFPMPVLAHIGEQGVLNKEIWANGDANDNLVFGYQERFAEARYMPSRISGQFRSDVATPLDMWHLSQDFTALPTLNATFIEENPPVDRVITVTSEPHFIADLWFQFIHARPLPVNGVPGFIDHF